MAKKKGRDDYYPLLIYKPLGLRWRSLGILLTVLSVVLWWFAPDLLPPSIAQSNLRHLALIPAFAGIVLALYGALARSRSSVTLRAKSLRIRTAFYPLVVSYKRIDDISSIPITDLFEKRKERAARRTWPRGYWGMTAVVVELKSYPLSERWLRLWIDKYLFIPNGKGFVFLVDEWMTLSNQLESKSLGSRARQDTYYDY
jgi:hypothetical protein